MSYAIGQKVCLWQIKVSCGEIRVLKEIIVTITDMKTGVPGQWSREPMSLQSLRGLGNDGQLYEKHWNSWPEAQTRDFIEQWSPHKEGENYWIPQEAVYVYDTVSRNNKLQSQFSGEIRLVDQTGQLIKPKGDVVYCEEHDRYSHAGDECFWCHIAKQQVGS